MGDKYYSPDFDPAKIPRLRRPKNNYMKVRMMLPMNIRCRTCGNFMYQGTKSNYRKEDVVGATYLGIQIFRFYIKCNLCSAEITMTTDPRNSDYVVESGASRNFEPRRAEEEEIEEEEEKRKAEEMGDALKSLENRTLDSRREIYIVSALDELKSMKSRRETVSVDVMLESLHKSNQQKERKLLEEDREEEEAYIRTVFRVQKNRRIDDDDDDLERSPSPLKRSKVVEEACKPLKRRVFSIMKKSSTATCKNKEEKDGLQSLIQQYAETTEVFTLASSPCLHPRCSHHNAAPAVLPSQSRCRRDSEMATSRALLLPFSFLRFDFSPASDGSNVHADFKLSRKEESREEQEKVVGQPELQSLGEEEEVEKLCMTNEVHTYLASWVYESGIPFNSINNDSFRRFVEAVGQFGPGYIPATQYQLREPLLKQAVDNTRSSMKEQEDEWKNGGCSIMTDAWSDRKRRSVMNICVNCKIGTSFLSFIECSLEAHTGKYIFDYVDKWIDTVGSKNVIQVVTDNATNNFAAAKLLKLKRPNIFWTSCAAHTLNLVLEAIGKTPRFKLVIDAAKSLTVYIYAHHTTLALMRKFTKKRDIVRPGVTRFASSFLTMQSMLEKQENLKYMFLSSEWSACRFATQPKGIAAYNTIVSQSFWTSLSYCVELFKPLVKLLRLVDGDLRPSMGFVYGELKDTKKEVIKICKDVKDFYDPIMYIIDSRVKDRLDSPLHLSAYLLNPYYYYRDDEVKKDPNCMGALLTCIEAFFPDDYETQHSVSNIELHKYKAMEGIFSRKLAISGRMNNDDNFNPEDGNENTCFDYKFFWMRKKLERF